MSSTRRGAVRSPNDFYKTDPQEIVRFIRGWIATDPEAAQFWSQPRKILDPAAGGLTEQVSIQQKGDKPPLFFLPSEMSYPKAINGDWCGTIHTVDTLDIRTNSRAAVKGDFLAMEDHVFSEQGYDCVITNPPFSLALAFIQKSLRVVKPGGYVVMLLRLNFFGSEERNKFFRDGNMPTCSYVHAKRLGFTPDNKCDSIEYQHCVWLNDDRLNHETRLRVLKY